MSPAKRTQEEPRRSFYGDHFQPEELADLEPARRGDLEDEIILLRVAARRVLALSEGVESLATAIKVLNSLGTASIRLAQLLKAQKELGKGSSELEEIISQALAEVVQELKEGA
jgi:hypothetical protein